MTAPFNAPSIGESRLARDESISIRLGIRRNLGQFLVQTLLVFFIGITIGLERTVVPLLAQDEFGIAKASVIISFVVSFGVVKATLNLWGGGLSERLGRKPVLVAGWLFALPVPFLIIYAPNWWFVVAANLFLGVNQGLAWSMTVTSKLDIVGSRRRGLAVGVNEFAGYGGVALSALVTGYLADAYGLRPAPFLFGLGVIVLGLIVSFTLARETLHHARSEARNTQASDHLNSLWAAFRWTSWGDRRAFAISQAGLVEKFVDTLVWLAYPLYFAARGLDAGEIGLLVFAYGISWGMVQLVTGPMSDQFGRKPLIVGGMLLCALGSATTVQAESQTVWYLAAVMSGIGMAMVYPTLIAAIGDIAHPTSRGATLGVYRFWRDAGYALGAVLIGVVIDIAGQEAAFYAVAAAMALSGLVVLGVMGETLSRRAMAASS